MKLRRLIVRRAPGFPDGGPRLEDASPALNLVTGPNGSGKTTLCRSLRDVLWPDDPKGKRGLDLEARFDHGGAAWDWSVTGKERHVTRGGLDADPPPLPPASLGRCFTLSIEDFFGAEGPEADFVREVTRAMSGGYRVRDVLEREEFSFQVKKKPAEAGQIEKARQVVREAQDAQRALQAEEDGLPKLEAQIADARAAKSDAETLEAALRRLELLAERDDADRVLAEYPVGMDALLDDDEKSLVQLTADRAQAEEQTRTAAVELDAARSEKDAADFPDGPPDSADRALLRERVESLARLAASVASLEDHAAETRGRLDRAAALLGATDAKTLSAFDAATLDDLDVLLRETHRLQAEESALRTELETLENAPEPENADALFSRANELRAWLRAGGGSVERPLWPARAAILLSAVCALVAALGPTLGFPIPVAAVLAGVSALLALAGFGATWWPARLSGSNERDVIAARWARERGREPVDWTDEGVTRALAELDERRASAQVATKTLERRGLLVNKLAGLERQQAELDGRWRRVRAATGLGAQARALTMVEFADRLRAWREADATHAAAESERDAAGARLAKELKNADALLAPYGYAPCTRPDQVKASVADLDSRAAQYERAVADMASAQRRRDEALRRVDAISERRAEFFKKRGLDDDDADVLRRRLRLLSDWRDAQRAALGARRDCERAEATVSDELKAMDTQALRGRLSTRSEIAAGLEKLLERRAALKEKLDAARERHDVADALDNLRAARDLMRAKMDAERYAAAARFLLEDAEAAHRSGAEPEMMKEAARLFALFTSGAYALRIEGDAPVAHDVARDNDLPLVALSTGTRMQLLLAIRAAFAQSVEPGPRLPLVLDDVLVTSDPERFGAVAGAVLELVKDGRQVFYLTCHPADAMAWKQRASAEAIDLREFALKV